jgi:hypothetical protein
VVALIYGGSIQSKNSKYLRSDWKSKYKSQSKEEARQESKDKEKRKDTRRVGGSVVVGR